MALPTTSEEIWPLVEKWPFAVLSFVTPRGESRSAGVMYKVEDRSIYVLTGPDTWKAKHIRANPSVSMTVTVQRLPIRVRLMPPAVITFAGEASVLDMGEVPDAVRLALTKGIDDIGDMCAIRVEPKGNFVTYGIGVPAMTMRHPDKSLARVPVA